MEEILPEEQVEGSFLEEVLVILQNFIYQDLDTVVGDVSLLLLVSGAALMLYGLYEMNFSADKVVSLEISGVGLCMIILAFGGFHSIDLDNLK